MTNYPNQIDNNSSLPSATGDDAVAINAVKDATIAIEEELGVLPAGIYADVRTRLDIIESRINNPLVPAPNVDNPFFISTTGVTIQTGAHDPNTLALPPPTFGSVFLRQDGYANQGLYLFSPDHQWHAITGAIVPSGTGFAHVTGGIQDSAAQLVFNADISSSAAISLSKLSAGAAVTTIENFGGGIGASAATNATALRAAFTFLNGLGGGTVVLANGTYAIDPGLGTPIVIPAKCSMVGKGMGKTIFSTTRNGVTFEVGGDYVSLYDFEIVGNSGGAQEGIRSFSGGASAWSFLEIVRVRIRAIGLYAFWIALQGTALHGARLIGCEAYNCGQGFRLQTEYTTCIGCITKDNTTGAFFVSGNLSWIGGEITFNTTGVSVFAGGNDSHSLISGTKINHNTNALVIGAIINGFIIDGCELFEGNIQLTTSTMVRFSNCELAATAYFFDGSTSHFDACTIINSYGGTINDSYNGNSSFELWTNCTDLNGNSVNTGYLNKTPVNGSQTLTYAESHATLLNLVAGASAGVTITSRKQARNNSTQTIRNNTSQTVTFGWKTGSTVNILTNTSAIIGCDGTNAVILMSGT